MHLSLLLKLFILFFLVFFFVPSPSITAIALSTALPNCIDKCGNITIPYPFGTSLNCYRDSGFYVACNATYDPPRAFVSTTNIELTDISLSDATATILTPIAHDCYVPLGLGPDINNIWTDVSGLPYTFSHARNKFTALGCDTVALNFEYNVLDYSSGCVSFCDDRSSIANGTCSGIGCCQTSIPKGMHRVYTVLRSLRNHTTTWNVSPCSYAFVVDQERFVFNLTDLYGFYSKNEGKVPTVMDWAIGNATCQQVNGTEKFSCGANSYCVDNDNGPGYRCNCNSGYQGNPYLADGCQDIDECADPGTSPCAGNCENRPGSYACSCPQGYYGDGKKSGSGCIKKAKRFPLVQVVLGSGLSFLFLLVSGSWVYWIYRKRKLIQLKEKFFKQNGGLLLQQQIASREGAAESAAAARIFTAEELKAATDDYSESRVLGRGGYGTVYEGVLPGGRVVAIKKSMVVDRTQIEQFVNEVVLLSQVIHKNVVRLLGCCLETPVPLLVYEFVSNGTLHHHIHGAPSSLSWETRLRIAAETSAALAYLHSAIARPIFHRDVKSANILLDNNYMAKVADFGASRLVPLDRTQITTLVQGTLGYLDPEYFQTGQLTEKSDVYSFGVVLAELLTGQKPLSQQRPEEERNLAIHFLLHMRENRLFRIVEPRVRSEGRREQLSAVAELTQRCLSLRGEDRPEMREVAAELERARRRIRTATADAAADADADAEGETRYYTGAPVMINTTGDVDLDEHILLSLEMRR